MEEVEFKIKVPEKLEKKMERFKWVDWSKVALKSFSERLEDIEEVELERKIAEISEISPDDKREVKESLVKEIEASCDKTFKDLESGKIKSMTLEELDKLMGLK